MSKKLISNLFNYATREGAESLVIENQDSRTVFNCRLKDGGERILHLPKKLEKDFGSVLRRILKMAPDELAAGRYCKIEDKDRQITFYLTIAPAGNGEKIIISIIPKNNQLLRLKQLGCGREHLKAVARVLRRQSGLILVSSPDNQGKSTTLDSLLQELNAPDRNLYFLGSRVRQKITGVNYMSATRGNWLKVMDHDSDIIATEIDSEETLENVFRAADSGRLVLAAITGDSVWEILSACFKLKLPLKLKLDSLKLITNQRLAPMKRTGLKIPAKSSQRREIGLFEVLELTPAIIDFLTKSAREKDKEKFWEKLGRLAMKEGYEPLSSEYQKKKKLGLL